MPRRTVDGEGGQIGEGGQGLQQAGSGRSGDAAILGVRVRRAVLVEEDDVLTHPHGADAALLGLGADDGQQLRRGERVGCRYPQIDAHSCLLFPVNSRARIGRTPSAPGRRRRSRRDALRQPSTGEGVPQR